MGGGQSHSLEIQISNNTRNINLKNHKILHEKSATTLRPQLSPGSSDSCRFSSFPNSMDITGLLIYEAESFTLAILVYIPEQKSRCPYLLQLELSLDKAHLGQLEEIMLRMSKEWDLPDADNTTVSRCEFCSKIQGTVTLSAGTIRVRATMSQEPSSLVKVVLEEWGKS